VPNSIPTVKLRRKHDQRVRDGHPWVFSNELDVDVAALPPGGTVDVLDGRGAFVGRGYCNPRSLIAVRLLTRVQGEDIDQASWFAGRLQAALQRRQALLPGRTSWRWVHGEGDDLPGLVIDKYEDVVVVQLGTLGMERRKELLADALRQVLPLRGAVLRSEGPARALEGLEEERALWFGEVPDQVDIDEYGVTFRVSLMVGQKTGHFFDQALNRQAAAAWCGGRTVLDVFANSGGWALAALKAGASSAVCVDRSALCGDIIRTNAALNGVEDRLEVVVGDAKPTLDRLRASGRRFGAVVLDPPAFAKSRKVVGAALRGYRELNAQGAALVEPGGLLFTSSCSWHVHEDRFLESAHAGIRDAGRRARLVRRGEQAPDHMVLPEVPETRYLKSLSFWIDT
jgi:23S rRNA (cytosine1962-C5)-methyltransferase